MNDANAILKLARLAAWNLDQARNWNGGKVRERMARAKARKAIELAEAELIGGAFIEEAREAIRVAGATLMSLGGPGSAAARKRIETLDKIEASESVKPEPKDLTTDEWFDAIFSD